MQTARGFSLFTPLIGTTVIVIAIMLSAVMIQNDVRISRAITSSFEQSNQEIAAKLIKASTEIQMLQGIENSVESYFTGNGGTVSYTYNCSYTACETTIKNEIKRSLENDLQTEIYSNILDNIESSTGYEAKERNCPPPVVGGLMSTENCLAQAIIHGLDIELTTVGDNYEIKFNINSNYQDAFAVKFESTASESIVISLAPEGLKYKTDTVPKEIVDNSVGIYKKFKTGESVGGTPKTYKEILESYNSNTDLKKIIVKNRSSGGSWNDVSVQIIWDNGYDLTLKQYPATNYNDLICEIETGSGATATGAFLIDRCGKDSKS